MNNIFVEVPTPDYWQDFELLTLDICRIKWKDDYAQRNGRQGQPQCGVDVYGYNKNINEKTGVQCKKRKNQSKGAEVPSSSLTKNEIDAEIKAMSSFIPKLDRFIIATTAQRDSLLQTYVRELNSKSTSIEITLWFWDDFVEILNENENLMYRYYSNVLKHRDKYSNKEHYLRMLALAFDRPAIRTPFNIENRATDFIEAMSLLQQAISTGILKDKNGHVVDQVKISSEEIKIFKNIKKNLQKIRNKLTEALKNNIIIQHQTVIEIRDHELVQELNELRNIVIAELNKILENNQIDAIEKNEY